MKIDDLIQKHKEITEEKKKIEQKISEYFTPLVKKARDNKDVDTLEEILEQLPNIYFKVLVYKTLYEITNK